MNLTPPVCCVIISDADNNILLMKRGREPYINKWSLISGIGYSKKGKTIEEGVIDEVAGDIGAQPTNVKKIFSITDGEQEVVVFIAQINKAEAKAVSPYVTELKWCTKEMLPTITDLAFDHDQIIKKYVAS